MDAFESVVLNLWTAWLGILAGVLAGIIQGMFFHKEDWLGGYNSWKRRMVRLGHISFFGIAFINISFAAIAFLFNITKWATVVSWLLVIGEITMPLVCYLSAYKKPFRNLFFIPVLSVLFGTIIFLIGMIIGA